MRTDIIHQLPGRIRLKLLPQLQKPMDNEKLVSALENDFPDFDFKINQRTNTLLVNYESIEDVSDKLLRWLNNFEPTIKKKSTQESKSASDPTGMDLVVSGSLLLLSPFFPMNVRNFLAMSTIIPKLKKGVKTLGKSKVNSDVGDALILGTTVGARGNAVASKVSYAMMIRDYLKK